MLQPNQYYPQPNNYMMQPPYQNFQSQQRQEQLDQLYTRPYNYNFVKERGEAERWPIAPGNLLVFADQNNMYFYTKSLGFGPNERPIFTVYKREDCVEPVISEPVEQNPLKEEFEKFRSSNELEMNNLKQSIEDLKELINQKPSFNNNKQFKKGGNNQ